MTAPREHVVIADAIDSAMFVIQDLKTGNGIVTSDRLADAVIAALNAAGFVIVSGDYKREIANAALYLPADKINDLQLGSIKRLTETLKWSHHADITVRRDGQDHHFEADWLKHLITPAKTADTEG